MIIENGSGIPGANSYVTDAYAQSWLSARPTQLASYMAIGDQLAREGKLVEAADFLNTFDWGLPLSEDQTMGIPTLQLGYVPVSVKTAQILLALEAVSGPLAPSGFGGAVIKERKKLDGVGEKEVEYAEASVGSRTFPFLEGLVGRYVSTTSGADVQVARRLVG